MALDKCMELLSFRARSESELKGRLRREGHPPEVIAAAIGRCRELGYVDDLAFARSHVSDRLRLKPRGRRALRSELIRKGVDRELAEEAIDAGFAEAGVTEADLARDLAGKRFRALRRLEPETVRRRLSGYLSRRGFDGGIVRRVVDEILEARSLN